MAMETEVFDRSFSVGDAGELVLSNISGTVDIRSWDSPDIRVSGEKRSGGFLPWVSPEEGFRATRVEMEQQGSRVVVRTTRLRDGFWAFVRWLGGVAQVDYTVRVPRHCNVVVDLVSGRLTLDGIQGNVIARTVSAGMDVTDVTGNLAASTVSGGVAATSVAGRAALRTVSGPVRAIHSRFDSLAAQTVSGALELETPLQQNGSYEFHTVSGDVLLAVPRDTRCSADVQGVSASIRSDLPADIRRVKSSHWQADVNGGGTPIRVRSVSGGLRIAEEGAVTLLPTPTPQPPAAEPAPEVRHLTQEPARPTAEASAEQPSRESVMMLILQAVERGELSVEEASAKLAELDSLGRGGAPQRSEYANPEVSDGC
jgi:hypothetical protein